MDARFSYKIKIFRKSALLKKESELAFRFENLEIWKMAIEYGERINKLVKKFPKSEIYCLSSDLNRAAISISSNIAEGSGSGSNREIKRYLGIALKSIFETVSQIFVARARDYITDEEFSFIYNFGERLARKTKSFEKSLR